MIPVLLSGVTYAYGEGELRRPVLLRCDRCAALVLGAGDSGLHDAWHDTLVPRPRVSPA